MFDVIYCLRSASEPDCWLTSPSSAGLDSELIASKHNRHKLSHLGSFVCMD